MEEVFVLPSYVVVVVVVVDHQSPFPPPPLLIRPVHHMSESERNLALGHSAKILIFRSSGLFGLSE